MLFFCCFMVFIFLLVKYNYYLLLMKLNEELYGYK